DLRLHVAERAVPDLDGVFLGLLRDDVEGAVDDPLGHRLLARVHDGVDELRHPPARIERLIRELRIRELLALWNFTLAWHTSLLRRLHLGRLAPYFERPCRRFVTPEVSSVPRMMW